MLMWSQRIQDIKKEKELPEPLVYLSSLSAEANNPQKATEQAGGFSPNLGAHGQPSGSGAHSPAQPILGCGTLSSLLHLPKPQHLIR